MNSCCKISKVWSEKNKKHDAHNFYFLYEYYVLIFNILRPLPNWLVNLWSLRTWPNFLSWVRVLSYFRGYFPKLKCVLLFWWVILIYQKIVLNFLISTFSRKRLTYNENLVVCPKLIRKLKFNEAFTEFLESG